MSKEILNNTIYIDAKILPSALNESFFNEIDLLSPFGPGNYDPSFMIENVKVLKYKIIQNKHINSILISKDRKSINAICFNAKNTELESYLCEKKKILNNMNKKQIKENDNKLVKSINKNVRSSTRKLNPILKAIVGKKVDVALRNLTFSEKRISHDVKKTISSAVANAENNFKQSKELLRIEEIIELFEGIESRKSSVCEACREKTPASGSII
mgnify:CR=1 FL=1